MMDKNHYDELRAIHTLLENSIDMNTLIDGSPIIAVMSDAIMDAVNSTTTYDDFSTVIVELPLLLPIAIQVLGRRHPEYTERLKKLSILV